jgi:hypothetical protein
MSIGHRYISIAAIVAVGFLLYRGLVLAAMKYFAVCGAQHGIVLGWEGPERDTYSRAERDAAEHRENFGDGHNAQVLSK